MSNPSGKTFSTLPLFDPSAGQLVRAPLGDGAGYWAGAPNACFDSLTNSFYLVYRQRQPKEQGRGIECRIAHSSNGVAFTDIWALSKATMNALSIERTALLRTPDQKWRLYIGNVDPATGRWQISMLEADEPDGFNISTRLPILTAESIGAQRVKDPNCFVIGGMIYLVCSYMPIDPKPGEVTIRSGVAISGNGRDFQWLGDVTPIGPLKQWDAYSRRISALLPISSGGYMAFYDGAQTEDENYEERTGLAFTSDLRTFHTLSLQSAALVSPHSSGSLRYLDVISVGDELFYYYEIARDDGAHELQMSVVKRE